MKIDLLRLVRASKIFSLLDDTTLIKLLDKFDKVYLHKNAILFHQGEIAQNLYLVVSGKLVLTLRTEHNEEKTIGEISSGETVGEIGALAHEPRSVTAKALENSILLKLSSHAFRELCQDYPPIIFETINTLVDRSRGLLKLLAAQEPERKHIVIIPANKYSSLKQFSEKLREMTHNISGIVLLSDEDPEVREKQKNIRSLEYFIDKLAKENEIILYLLGLQETALTKICFEKANTIYVVADFNSKPSLSYFTLAKINRDTSPNNINVELVLLHEEDKHLPQRTSRWLKLARFALHHHVRINQAKDWQRMLRFIRGQAIGLVFGGGGVRGWAHLGVIKALQEANIPIDIVGGTSGGAIIAGYYAMHETYQELHNELKELSKATRKSVSLSNLNWPAIALFTSRAYTKDLKRIFGDNRIENFWLPCFFIACNLVHNKQVIHRSGPAWIKVRSSTAVPGVFPPVVIRGELYIDGGLLNNLPVDVMRKLIGNKATIIAAELTHNKEDVHHAYNFPPDLAWWQTALAKFHIAYKKYKFPPFIDTFLKSLLSGSSYRQRENGMAADILITPDLSQFSLLHIKKNQEAELVDIGYQVAVKAIGKLREKQRQEK